MGLIETMNNVEQTIIEYGEKLLQDNSLQTHQNSIFHNVEVTNYSKLYTDYKGLKIWIIENFDKHLYNETIGDYLLSNQTPHGKSVYESYLTHKEYFENEYFNTERDLIIDKSGLLFVKTEINEKEEIVKVCYFHPISF